MTTPSRRLNLNVLLVDDDPLIRKSYGNQIRAEGWLVTIANDGHAAMKAVEEQTFDAILLDLRMPGRNGAEVLRALRARPDTAATAVFLLAQPGDAELVDRAMREGADGVFETVRVTPRDVMVEITAYFNSGVRDGNTGAIAAPPEPPPQPVNVPSAVDEIAKRFRKTTIGRDDDVRASRPGTPRPGSATNYSQDPSAAARAVAERVLQRDRDRGPPISRRQTVIVDDSQDVMPPAPQPPEQQQRQDSAAPPALEGPAFCIVLNRFMGESAKLAGALGIPSDFQCPVCRQQIALRVWVDPTMEAGVRGHFYCPRCTGA